MSSLADRDAIMLIGDAGLERVLRVISASRVFVARQPLDAIRILVEHAESLQMVVVAAELEWRAELAELLEAEYPEVRLVVVSP
ncbi:MAG TPA: hypothetical protein VFV99_15300 [Kofleriaceae bacterium]|nr:hypothetical protein [Kofleriaceae bacterium]